MSSPLSFRYRGYGSLIASELRLPELPTADDAASTPDIKISLGRLPDVRLEEGPVGARRIGPFLWAERDRFWFCVPGIARFQIIEGREIVVDPDTGGDEDGVRAFLLGTALGVVLMQRGHLVLHGSAVRVGDGCLICVGPSGAGKSTLAAGFHRRGFTLLADDLVVVDEQCRVLPGVPRIKLWADAARTMAIDTAPLRRIRANLEKFSYPVGVGFADRPYPVRAIYSLASANTDAVTIDRLAGFGKFTEVRGNTYRPQFVEAMALRARYLAQCTRLSSTIPVGRVVRPVLGFTVDRIIDCLVGDVETAA